MRLDTAADYYVAPDGNDEWSGTTPEPNAARSDGPFASVRRAHECAAARIAATAATDVLVRMRGGRYYVEPETVASIAASRRIVFAPYGEEEAICSSGVDIPGWRRRQDWYLTLYLPPLYQEKAMTRGVSRRER